jgi:hypothetical protein
MADNTQLLVEMNGKLERVDQKVDNLDDKVTKIEKNQNSWRKMGLTVIAMVVAIKYPELFAKIQGAVDAIH